MTEIPYFEGDFWLNVIEETIKELDQEAREREASEQATSEVGGAPSPRKLAIVDPHLSGPDGTEPRPDS